MEALQQLGKMGGIKLGGNHSMQYRSETRLSLQLLGQEATGKRYDLRRKTSPEVPWVTFSKRFVNRIARGELLFQPAFFFLCCSFPRARVSPRSTLPYDTINIAFCFVFPRESGKSWSDSDTMESYLMVAYLMETRCTWNLYIWFTHFQIELVTQLSNINSGSIACVQHLTMMDPGE